MTDQFVDLSLAELSLLDHVLEAFEQAWIESPPPDLRTFLDQFVGAKASARREGLCELVLLDMAQRWCGNWQSPGMAAGGSDSTVLEESQESLQRFALIDYVEQFPELGPEHQLPIRLVVEEYRLRKLNGENPSHNEYIKRFEVADNVLKGQLKSIDESLKHNTLRIPESPSSSDSSHGSQWSQLLTPSHQSFPVQFGDYEIEGEIGRGGMGVVFRARHLALDRIVALKIIKSGVFASQEEIERFRVDAHSAASLQHPNIVPVYDVGELDGIHYFTMALVEGSDLGALVRNESQKGSKSHPRIGQRKAASLMQKVSDALSYVHQRGLIHRDLKPGNILIDEKGEPRITDFGLAKQLDSEQQITMTAQILGTPYYMSPEQAQCDHQSVSTVSDIYSLGAILYHLITGEPPLHGTTLFETLKNVAEKEPVRPGLIHSDIDKDLDVICLKCLEKEPKRRFQSAAEVEEELQRYLDGQPIRSRRLGKTEYLIRLAGRNPAMTAALTAVVISLILGTVISTFFAFDANRQAVIARKNQEIAAEKKTLAERNEILGQLRSLRLYGKNYSGWIREARQLLAEAKTRMPAGQFQDQRTATLTGMDAQPIRGFGAASATSLLFHPDGDRLIIGGSDENEDNRARIWDRTGNVVQSSEPTRQFGPVGWLGSVPVQLVRADPTSLWFRSLPQNETIATISIPSLEVDCVESDFQWCLSADGTRAAASVRTKEGTRLAWVWELPAGKQVLQTEVAPNEPVDFMPRLEKPDGQLALSPGGHFLAVGNGDGSVVVIDQNDGSVVSRLKLENNSVHCLEFSRKPGASDRSSEASQWMIAVGHAGGTTVVWDIERSVPISICRGSYHAIYALAFTPDATLLATGGRHEFTLWDVMTGNKIFVLRNRANRLSCDYVMDLSFSADRSLLAVAGKQGHDIGDQVHVWDLHSISSIKRCRGLNGPVGKICFSPDEALVAALSQNWKIGIWDTGTGKLKRLLTVPTSEFSDSAGLVFSHNGQQLAYCNGQTAMLFDVANGQRIRQWDGLAVGLQNELAFHSDGTIRLVRFETLDGKQIPFSNDRIENPFVCRAFALQTNDSWKLLSELSTRFYHIKKIRICGSGTHYVLFGTPLNETDQRKVMSVETETAKVVWSRPGGVHGNLWTDAAHNYVFTRQDPSEGNVAFSRRPFDRDEVLEEGLPVRQGWAGPHSVTLYSGRQSHGLLKLMHFEEGEDPRTIMAFDRDDARLPHMIQLSPKGSYVTWDDASSNLHIASLVDVRREGLPDDGAAGPAESPRKKP